jgi:hypothetical protein
MAFFAGMAKGVTQHGSTWNKVFDIASTQPRNVPHGTIHGHAHGFHPKTPLHVKHLASSDGLC